METKKKNEADLTEGDENIEAPKDSSTDPSSVPTEDDSAELDSGQVKENSSSKGSSSSTSREGGKPPEKEAATSEEELLKLNYEISQSIANMSELLGLIETLKLISIEDRLNISYWQMWVEEGNKVLCTIGRQRIKRKSTKNKKEPSQEEVKKVS